MGSSNISNSGTLTIDSNSSGGGREEVFIQPSGSRSNSGTGKHGRQDVLLRVLLWLAAPRGLLLRMLPEFVQGTPLVFAVGVWAGKCTDVGLGWVFWLDGLQTNYGQVSAVGYKVADVAKCLLHGGRALALGQGLWHLLLWHIMKCNINRPGRFSRCCAFTLLPCSPPG